MNKSFELRFAGSGGQGVILASIILAEAALKEPLNVAQSQSYGPEARGGMCKADVVIANSDIDFPQVEEADCLLALTQESLDKYMNIVRKDGVIVTDSKMDISQCKNGEKIIAVAILDTASEVVGNEMTANIVALGALNAAMNLVSEENLEEAVLKHVPAKTKDLNIRALNEGRKLILGG